VIFNIRNFTKPFSLHKQGMRVMYRSEKGCTKGPDDDVWGDSCWTPTKEEAVYTRTSIVRSGWRIPGPLNIDDEEDDD
jgi:hypothetical protein